MQYSGRQPEKLYYINSVAFDKKTLLVSIVIHNELKLKTIDLKRINFAFLDAAHTFKDVIYEFNFVSKLQKSGDIIFFDDFLN